MEAYAVIETGGKQYRVQQGDVVSVELIEGAEAGQSVEITRVLAINDGTGLKIGAPTVDGAKVLAEVVEEPPVEIIILIMEEAEDMVLQEFCKYGIK